MRADGDYIEDVEVAERRRLLPKREGRLIMQGPLIWGLLALLLLFYLNGALRGPSTTAPAAPTYSGFFSPVDGDTVTLGDDQFRLWGIDAPDTDGPANEYYVQSGAALLSATSYSWTCEDVGQRSLEQIVAKCRFDNGAGSISAWMVRNGYAVDWTSISGGAFAEEQRLARAERLGIWQTVNESWR